MEESHTRLCRESLSPQARPRGYAATADVCAGSRGRAAWVGLRSWGQHEAAAEEIEVRAAKHLAFQHFEAIDVPLDRAIRPGQRHPGFDGRIVVAEPGRKALHGLQRTGGRAL